MYETPGALRITPKRLPEDVLNIYRLMPSHDNEQLLAHIAWLEDELAAVKTLKDVTPEELIGASTELLQQQAQFDIADAVPA